MCRRNGYRLPAVGATMDGTPPVVGLPEWRSARALDGRDTLRKMRGVRTGRWARIFTVLLLVWIVADSADMWLCDRPPASNSSQPDRSTRVRAGATAHTPITAPLDDECFCCSHNVMRASAPSIVPASIIVRVVCPPLLNPAKTPPSRLDHPPQLV